MMINKDNKAYKTIGEVVKILKLNSKKNISVSPHTLRYWEKEFKQIKPKIFKGNRRYYCEKDILLLQKIVFLLKQQGMTIAGVKRLLDSNKTLKLDELSNDFIKTANLKNKLEKISKLIKYLKSTK